MVNASDSELAAVRTPVSVARAAIAQLRPKQWTKNVFLFAALVFSGQFLVVESVQRSVTAFVAFSLLASSGYVFNDFLDREADRKHPKRVEDAFPDKVLGGETSTSRAVRRSRAGPALAFFKWS